MKGESLKEIIFNTFKIKYDLIDSMFLERNIKIENEVSIYINFESLMNKFYNRSVIDEDPIYKENYMNFTAYILNMIIHYRRYMNKRSKKDTKIFILYKLNNGAKMCSDYSLIKNCIDTNMKLLSKICPYIPGVYFIDTTSFYSETGVITYLISENPDRFHWIISRELDDIQCLNSYGEATDDILVTLLKYDMRQKENTSAMLYRGCMFKEMMRLYNVRSEKAKKSCDYLDTVDDATGLLPVIKLVCSGRYIYSKSYAKVLEIVYKNRKTMYVGQIADMGQHELIDKLYSKKEIDSVSDFRKIVNNAYIVCNARLESMFYNKEDQHEILSKIYDLKNRSLEEINDLEYMEDRLFVDVESLIKGGDIVGKRKIKW